MKKHYFSPELDFIKITMSPVLSPSTYDPDPQNPIRDGDDNPESGDL